MSDFLTVGFTLQYLNIIIDSIKTGIWIIDIIISAFIVFNMNKLTNYLYNKYNRINYSQIQDIIINFFRKRKKRTYNSDRKCNYEYSFNVCNDFILAICDYIDRSITNKSNNIDISNIKEEEDYTINDNDGYGESLSTLIRLGKINIPDFNIEVEFRIHNKEREEKQVRSEYKEVQVDVYSDTLHEIDKFVKYILDNYERNIDLVTNKTTNIYSCRKFGKDSGYPKYFELELQKDSNFDNIFFDNKELLKKLVEDVYFGKRDRLSLLLHGPPGTGKDSVTVAICNYLNELEKKYYKTEFKRKHIIRYPMDVFKTADELFRIFFGNDKIAGKKIPNNQQVRFFTEIEKYTDIILKEKFKEALTKNNNNDKNLNESVFEFIKDNTDMKIDEKNINIFEDIKKNFSNNSKTAEIKLAHLIECLDSILNQKGTINIFTTNLPLECIDDVLIRHERLDPFYLGYCSSKSIVDIIKNYYNNTDDIDTTQFDKLKKLTPSDITYYCKNNTIIDNCIQNIIKDLS